MGIFGKEKKEEEEDALIEKLTKSPEKPASTGGGSGTSKGNLSAEVEKIGAQIGALREVLQAQQERFERQSEEIGELRSALAEREKHMRDIESKAMKAAELVEEVQPENLMSEQKKADIKIEALKAKMESFENVSGNIVEELKKIKGTVSVFRGLEEVIKLNKEIQGELLNLRKMEATIEKHADHVEAMFTSFEANFSAFEKMKEDIKNLSQICDSVKKENDKNSVAIKDMPRKDEFYQVKTAAETTLNNVQATLGEMKKENETFISRNNDIESKANLAHETAKKAERNAIELKNDLDGVIDAVEKAAKMISEGNAYDAKGE